MIHICNNYVSSRVHCNLVEALAFSGPQTVIVPVRKSKHVGINRLALKDVVVDYVRYPALLLRFFPLIKTFVVFLLCCKKIFLALQQQKRAAKGASLCVAHNLWSDGAIAFYASFFFDLRYSLVVRNTDINVFVPKLPHWRWLIRLMVRRSEGMIFVSAAHRDRFSVRWPSIYNAAKKVSVIPNGVDSFWIESAGNYVGERPLQVAYVGRFDENKNLRNLLLACEGIAESEPDFRLVLAGGEARELKRVARVDTIPSFVDLAGVVTSRHVLQSLYRSSRCFAMPSFRETFGLVYIEALSQGCALVCTKSEGVDGLFSSDMVLSVDPYSPTEIRKAIKSCLVRNARGAPHRWVCGELQRFSWDRVAREYMRFFV